MVTREDELLRALGELADKLPDPLWVALVDDDGLIMASVPSDPPVNTDRISAMTAAIVLTGSRVLREIEAGELRYVTTAGSERQVMTVVLGEGRHLSLGLKPSVRASVTFSPLSTYVPQLMKILHKRMKAAEE